MSEYSYEEVFVSEDDEAQSFVLLDDAEDEGVKSLDNASSRTSTLSRTRSISTFTFDSSSECCDLSICQTLSSDEPCQASLVEPSCVTSRFESVAAESEGPWDDESFVKARRGRRDYHNPVTLYGKSRRLKCYRSCCSSYKTEITRYDSKDSPADSYLPLRMRNHIIRRGNGGNVVPYSMTRFDLDTGGAHCFSLNKHKRWSEAKSLLLDNARVVAHRKDCRKYNIEIFDLEVVGVLAHQVTQGSDSFPKTRKQKQSMSVWRAYQGETRYYQHRTSKARNFIIGAADSEVCVSRQVRIAPKSHVVELDDTYEAFIPFTASFHSRNTRLERGCSMTFPMIDEGNVTRELRCVVTSYSSYYSTPYVSTKNFRHCWASTPAPSPDYEEWYMEVDIGGNNSEGQVVRGLVLQGRSPQVETYPSSSMFISTEAWKAYTGPIYPVIVGGTNQFVTQFEVLARMAKGSWFSLGIFKGNTDERNQVRVDLPSISEMRLRYLRIRPLSERKKGFHGAAPAFKLGIIGENNNVNCMSSGVESKQIIKGVPPQVAPGFVRYEVQSPTVVKSDIDTDEAVRAKSARVKYSFYGRSRLSSGYDDRLSSETPKQWIARNYRFILDEALSREHLDDDSDSEDYC